VLIGIYFAWANLKTTEEAQRNTQKNQTDALQITQKGQITDRFTKAIDQLGSPEISPMNLHSITGPSWKS
jgi:hypothetical protein